MTVICRMLELPAGLASDLQTNPSRLPDAIKSARLYSDVYRYWHAIEYLLAQHSPGSPTARWLNAGTTVSEPSGEIPGARVISPTQVAQLAAALQGIEPEDLAPHYDARELDRAAIYPRTWQEWEETFDPLGQVLEHCSFLQSRARSCAAAGNALLLVFEESDMWP